MQAQVEAVLRAKRAHSLRVSKRNEHIKRKRAAARNALVRVVASDRRLAEAGPLVWLEDVVARMKVGREKERWQALLERFRVRSQPLQISAIMHLVRFELVLPQLAAEGRVSPLSSHKSMRHVSSRSVLCLQHHCVSCTPARRVCSRRYQAGSSTTSLFLRAAPAPPPGPPPPRAPPTSSSRARPP